ncbi:MAG: Ig-like domain-containing protein [Synergistaceae bacterium]|nr:Ig-like domain-containing protein [Synergistaceae bacterium]
MKRIILLVLGLILLVSPVYAATYQVGGIDYGTLDEACTAAVDAEDSDPVFNFTSTYDPSGVISILTESIFEGTTEISLSDFTSVTFSGTFKSYSGARHFIVNNSSLTINFSGITFTGNSGGGVKVEAGTVTFSGVTFSGINAGSNSYDDSNGDTITDDTNGALHLAGGTVTFSGTNTFSDNTAVNGGAIYLASGVAPTFEGTATFTGNKATENGGAIYADSGSTLTFTSAPAMTGNSATNGGAVYVNGGTLNFNADATLGGTSANANSATNGGIFYIASGTINFNNAVTFAGSSNAGTTNGGALYLAGGTVNFASTSTFTSNKASGSGGAIYLAGGSVNFTGESIFGQTASTPNTANNGGALCITAGTANFAGSATFSYNSATNNGGAIFVSSDANMPNFETTVNFERNSAGSANGGAIFYGASDPFELTNVYKFSNNTAANDGGAIYSESANIDIADVNISTRNTATNGRGGFAASNYGTITVNNSSFSNQLASSGGALSANILNITSSDFTSNTSTAKETNTNKGGGAVSVITSSGGSLILNSVRFTSNTANYNGGAIFTNNADVTAENVYLTANKTAQTSNNHGGAMSLEGSGTKSLTQVTFAENESYSGGAVYGYGALNITESYFRDNHAVSEGGAIYYNQTGGTNNFSLASSMFSSNAATAGRGGAIFVYADSTSIESCTFDQNSAINGTNAEGGAIRINGGTITNCTFTRNQALTGSVNSRGGALAVYGTVTVSSCTFTLDNTATTYGGGIYIGQASTLRVNGTILVGNGASIGADVYRDDGATRISLGYNRIAIYGAGGNNTSWVTDNGADTDRESSSWLTSTFFGSNTLSVNAYNGSDTIPPYIGAKIAPDGQVRILTMMLAEVTSLAEEDRATNVIPYELRYNYPRYDERGVDRRATNTKLDIGATFFDGTNPSDGDELSSYTVSSIVMSGIPNTLKSPGQTANLTALVRYTNGRSAYAGNRTGEEKVTWSSSNQNILRIDNNGVITAWQTPGTAYITVTTQRTGSNGLPASDMKAVVVDYQASEMNLSEAFIRNLYTYNQSLYEYDMSVAVASANSSVLANSSFRSTFANTWGSQPSLIANLTENAAFSTEPQYNLTVSTAANETFHKPGVKFAYSGSNAGDLMPVTYSWSFTGAEAKEIFGYDFADKTMNAALASEIFSKVQIDFASSNQAWHVMPSSNVTASTAHSAGILALSQSDSGQGIRIDLTVYLANVAGNAGIVNNLLIVPDGVRDSNLTGTMWMTKYVQSSNVTPENPTPTPDTGNNNTTSGGGGGGGCNSLGLGLVAAALFIMKRK